MIEDLLRIEAENIQIQKKDQPRLFVEPTFVDNVEFLSRFGINIPKPTDTLKAYVKLYPHDFIVEEIDSNNKLHTVSFSDTKIQATNNEGDITSWSCTMVKCGITTIEAVKDIAGQLGIPEQNITFAGIKDKQALTSQRIAIKSAPLDSIMAIKSSNFFLKDIESFKGVLNQGSLIGNKFSLRLRFDTEISEGTIKSIESAINLISKDGYLNFFYLQRFGVPRFLSHAWGMYILQNKDKDLIRSILFEDSPNELEFFRKLRKDAFVYADDLSKVKALYAQYPIYLGQENALFAAIRQDGSIDYSKIKSYAQLWVNAFASLLWNEQLSQAISSKDIPNTLPLLLTMNPSVSAMYKPYLEFLGIKKQVKDLLHALSFISLQDKNIETKAGVSQISYSFSEKYMNISFVLPKGSYATCFLSHFVDIVSGTPLQGTYAEYAYADVHGIHKEAVEYFKSIIEASRYRSE